MSFAGDKVGNDRIHCPYHPVAGLVDDQHSGDLICPECGLVVLDRHPPSRFNDTRSKGISKTNQMSIGLITTNDLISRFCAKLGLPPKVHRWATHIARKATEIRMFAAISLVPISVAASAIYMASQRSEQKKTAKEIGDITGVAEITISQSHLLMYPYAKELFPEDMKDSAPQRH